MKGDGTQDKGQRKKWMKQDGRKDEGQRGKWMKWDRRKDEGRMEEERDEMGWKKG